MPLLVSFYWTWEISPSGLFCQSIALGVYDIACREHMKMPLYFYKKNVGEAETRESHPLVFFGRR